MTQQEAVERQCPIEVGDILVNCLGQESRVTAVNVGEYGLLIDEEFEHCSGRVYFPYELAPVDGCMYDWHGWAAYDATKLPNGQSIGGVSLSSSKAFGIGVEEYDAKWADTPQGEPIQCRPTPYRVD